MHRSRGGMDWIALDRRMAIYARDGFDCVWCRGVFPLPELGHGLTLDHVAGPSNDPSNLVTACKDCNSIRKDWSMARWLRYLRSIGYRVADVVTRLRAARAGMVDRQLGRRLARARRPRYANFKGA